MQTQRPLIRVSDHSRLSPSFHLPPGYKKERSWDAEVRERTIQQTLLVVSVSFSPSFSNIFIGELCEIYGFLHKIGVIKLPLEAIAPLRVTGRIS